MRYVLLFLSVSALAVISLRWEQRAIEHDATTVNRYDYQVDPVEIACPRNVPVLVILGQSNAANYGTGDQIDSPHVNFYEGRCYRARDPLLGATGDRASVWTRLPGGPYVIALVAKGGAHMADLAPGGALHGRIEDAIADLAAVGLKPHRFLIQQGESEGNSQRDPSLYESNAIALIRKLQRHAPVHLASTTRCLKAPNLAIRAAQERARQVTGALSGPDLDPHPRVNGCHLGEQYLERVAQDWAVLLDLRPQ